MPAAELDDPGAVLDRSDDFDVGAEAEEAARDREEGLVDVGSSFVAKAQTTLLVQPGDRTLDDPAFSPEPGAVRALGPSDLRLDPAPPELAASRARVVGAVAEELAWPRRGRPRRPRKGGIASTSGSN